MIYPKTAQGRETIAAHYNDLDPFYRAIWGEHVHHGYWKTGRETVEVATFQLTELVAEQAQLFSGAHVCDVGCGYGATSRLLASNWGAKVTALSISAAQLAFAKSKSLNEENPNFLLCDFLENQLPDRSFDAVISIESSEHMVDKEKFFSESFRLLRKGGRFVTCAWLSATEPRPWEERLLLEPICREGRLPNMGSEVDYFEMMQNAGFQDIQFQDLSSAVKKTWSIIIRRTMKAFFTDPDLRAFVLNKEAGERIFAKTLFRLWGSFLFKSMRYGIFTAQKP
ncbi:MAG TPA: class I SAM-dependent methyltransferase [Rhabdochlamydiaceae bacterium]|nr:class I SAM-dependent methyltransferase [Rhabdochlamydiaceae bacterium]